MFLRSYVTQVRYPPGRHAVDFVVTTHDGCNAGFNCRLKRWLMHRYPVALANIHLEAHPCTEVRALRTLMSSVPQLLTYVCAYDSC